MGRLCIIPARGGSKRIPGKNIRPFLGKPIIAYSIEAALRSELFTEVLVSTDSEEIAGVARSYGASVPFLRSAAAADDHATTAEVLREVHTVHPGTFTQACCLYATAPFVSPELLRRTHRQFTAGDWLTCLPALSFDFPIQRALRQRDGGGMEMFYPEHQLTRSQDLEPAYHDAGMFYWYQVEHIAAGGQLYSDRSCLAILPALRAHDIDTIEDWEIAELKYQLLEEQR